MPAAAAAQRRRAVTGTARQARPRTSRPSRTSPITRPLAIPNPAGMPRTRAARPPTPAQLAAREKRERERQERAQARAVEQERARQMRANQRERERYQRAQARKLDEYYKALAAKAAREKREQLAREKKQLREQEARIRQQLRQQQRRQRDDDSGGRTEYAALAKAKPYESWKYRGQPAPALRGVMRHEVNIAEGAGGAKLRGRLPNMDETPEQIRRRAARNELRVRQARGIVHDLELDMRQAELEYKAQKRGTQAYETKRAKYQRAQAAYDRAWKAYEHAYEQALAAQREASRKRRRKAG